MSSRRQSLLHAHVSYLPSLAAWVVLHLAASSTVEAAIPEWDTSVRQPDIVPSGQATRPDNFTYAGYVSVTPGRPQRGFLRDTGVDAPVTITCALQIASDKEGRNVTSYIKYPTVTNNTNSCFSTDLGVYGGPVYSFAWRCDCVGIDCSSANRGTSIWLYTGSGLTGTVGNGTFAFGSCSTDSCRATIDIRHTVFDSSTRGVPKNNSFGSLLMCVDGASKPSRKGIAITMDDVTDDSLQYVNVTWFYVWAPTVGNIRFPKSTEFVPMIWDEKAVTNETLSKAVANSNGTLLGFNEPDNEGQAYMTVDHALELWPQLEATGLRLGSPAVTGDADVEGKWFSQFMAGAKDQKRRIDFVCVHWYGEVFNDTAGSVTNLTNYLVRVHDKYRLPVWLTEYALIKFLPKIRWPTYEQQAEFAEASVHALNLLPFVERFAWYGSAVYYPPPMPEQTNRLYLANGTASMVANVYRDVQ